MVSKIKKHLPDILAAICLALWLAFMIAWLVYGEPEAITYLMMSR